MNTAAYINTESLLQNTQFIPQAQFMQSLYSVSYHFKSFVTYNLGDTIRKCRGRAQLVLEKIKTCKNTNHWTFFSTPYLEGLKDTPAYTHALTHTLQLFTAYITYSSEDS